MSLPIAENIPEINFNIGELKRHSFLSVFIDEPEKSVEERKLRTWLIHTVFSACRHYSNVRDLVIKQNNADQQRDYGLVLHLLDVSEHIEDCIAGTYRSCMAVRRLSDQNKYCKEFISENSDAIQSLEKLRNQFEHMHCQIVAGQSGNGPISIVLANEGKSIHFRNKKVSVSSLFILLQGLFKILITMYPKYEPSNTVQANGPTKLTITFNATTIPRNDN